MKIIFRHVNHLKRSQPLKRNLLASSMSHYNFSSQVDNISTSPPLYKICMTGGPCAGKTTALTHLQNILSQFGFRVFCVPEAATLLMKGGAMINSYKFTFNQAVKFQTNLMKTQIALEDIFTDLALNENLPAVILCDRGLMDGSAYISEEQWSTVLDEIGLTPMQLRDKRYDAVIHMVTAADGAEEFYNKGNEARYENVQQALDIDMKIRNAYLGHYKFFIVDNKGVDFNQKIDKCVDIVTNIIGKPSPNSFFKKFLIKIPNPTDHKSIGIPPDVKTVELEVVQTLIKSPLQAEDEKEVEIYVRKRGSNSAYVYNYEIRFNANNQRIQKQRMITAKEYLELLQQKANNIQTLKKIRTCFVYERQPYTIETILNLEGQPTFLRAETTNSDVIIPPFIEVIKDVTNDDQFATPNLSDICFPDNVKP